MITDVDDHKMAYTIDCSEREMRRGQSAHKGYLAGSLLLGSNCRRIEPDRRETQTRRGQNVYQ